MAAAHIVCLFDHAGDLVRAAGAAREQGVTVTDAYAPYPVHGLGAAMGLPPSRLPWVCFALGLAGGAAMLLFQHWTSAMSWPINVGGRPLNSIPAFVPVTFEVMVLAAAAGTVGAFLVAARLRPGRQAEAPDARVTDDRFALVLVAHDAEERRRIDALLAHVRPAAVEERRP